MPMAIPPNTGPNSAQGTAAENAGVQDGDPEQQDRRFLPPWALFMLTALGLAGIAGLLWWLFFHEEPPEVVEEKPPVVEAPPPEPKLPDPMLVRRLKQQEALNASLEDKIAGLEAELTKDVCDAILGPKPRACVPRGSNSAPGPGGPGPGGPQLDRILPPGGGNLPQSPRR